jgi:methylmalonyl-CoA mutase cobalamin-binding subunit
MGAQVTVDELLARTAADGADAVLVSQVVTQRNAHLHNAKQMAAAFHEAYPAGSTRRPLLVVGGPRFDTVRPEDLGVDRIFGRGTTPAEVASYLVHALLPGGPR